MSRILALFGLALLLPLAQAQDTVRFPSTPWPARGSAQEARAVLTLPPDGEGQRRPAVVLVHTSGGSQHLVTGRYAKALAQAGFVALEPVLFETSTQASSRPGIDYLPIVYGALHYLAARPDVDAERIALAGFSLGGFLSVMSATSPVADQLGQGKRFHAHAPFYPSCWVFSDILDGRNKQASPARLARWTGAPVRIFAGGKDDYDARDPKACDEFVGKLPEDARRHFSVQLYPEATHGWDHVRGLTFYEPKACKGRGCNNQNVPDEETTRRSIADLMAFLREAKP
ncbi:MAG TPA: dienelactone hydrolase family protein [Burkholderiales bacterium]|nr:dienelactone hydrolase family protein [Burkholderiales bacterium]